MNKLIYNDIINRDAAIAVIGLGYVGLPIALEFARKTKVVGFDINEERVEMMKNMKKIWAKTQEKLDKFNVSEKHAATLTCFINNI